MKIHRFLLLASFFIAGCSYRSEELDFQLSSIQIQDRNGITETISTPERLEPYRQLDYLATQPYKKIIRIFKQNGKMGGKITTYHPNGQVHQYLESQDMRAYGAYKEWHPNGVLKIDATIIGGSADVVTGSQRDWIFDGIAKVWDEQSRLVAEIPYSKGVLEGESLVYDPTSGFVQSRSPYSKGTLEGTLIEYYPNEKIRSQTTFRQGIKNGESAGYWENGEFCWKEIYQNGPLLEGQYFSLKGEQISHVTGGFGFQATFRNGCLEQMIECRRGYPEGAVRLFLPNGELKSIYHIKNGHKQGEEIQYYPSQDKLVETQDPLPKLSIPWETDRITGIVKTWYNNGKLESQRELSRNKKNGSSLGWYRDGSLMYMEEYEEDVLTKGQYFKKNHKESVSAIINGNGLATLFDENGIFLRKVQYTKGKPVDPE